MTAAILLRPKHRPSSITARMEQATQRDRTMNAIGALCANAPSHGARVFVAKQIVRYGAVCLAHALGLTLTAGFLASLAGQIEHEAKGGGL